MSDFRFGCPHCGQRIEGDAAYRGRQITCPACQKTINVPAPAAKASVADLVKAAHPPAEPRLSSLALIAFVCSFGLAVGSLPGIVLGHLARRQMRRHPALRGRRLATGALVISYFSLCGSVALVAVGFLVLRPKVGHQLTQPEQAANTAAVLAARRVDEVKIGDPVSEQAHEMRTRGSGSGIFSDRAVRDAAYGGAFSYQLRVDPKRPMNLYCTYWGNDGNGRRFDVLINDTVIATQTLNFNDPGHFFDVEYAIPENLTAGQSTVTVSFQAYPQKTAGGLYGCQMLARASH
ncbi:MAG TPA: DUF4190 domain-containing protein [Verrucomicrobiae bacterium]